jgi:hypothetical protein
MSAVRDREARDDARERLSALLHVHELRVDAPASPRRLLHLLLLLGRGLPAEAARTPVAAETERRNSADQKVMTL